MLPRPATAQFIATALSRKAGTLITLDDIGLGSATSSANLEEGLDYPADVPTAGLDGRFGARERYSIPPGGRAIADVGSIIGIAMTHLVFGSSS